MNKKIAFVSRRSCYPLGLGGAEISIYQIMSRLSKAGGDVLIIGELLPVRIKAYIKEISKLYPKYSIKKVDHGFIIDVSNALCFALVTTSGFYNFSISLLSEWKPDFIFTQLDGCMEINSFAQENNIKTIHFLRDSSNPYNLDILKAQWIDLDKICFISNSHFIEKYYRSKHGIKSTVSYPLPQHCDCNASLTPRHNKRLRILFVNPHLSKGKNIVLELVKFYKDSVEFHIVEGWNKAEIVALKNEPNLIIHRKQVSLCHLYQSCDILLIPSQAQEAFSRVAIEGLQHGLTIIASKHSGLIESVGDGGYLVEKYWTVDEWINILNQIIERNDILRDCFEKSRQQFQDLYRIDPVKVIVEQLTSES